MTARADDPDKWPRPIWYVEDDGKVFRIVYFPYREQVPPAKVPDPGKVVLDICKACPHYQEGKKKFLSERMVKELFDPFPTKDTTVTAKEDKDRMAFARVLGAIMEYAAEGKRMEGDDAPAWKRSDPIDPVHPIRLADEVETRLYGHGYVKVGI